MNKHIVYNFFYDFCPDKVIDVLSKIKHKKKNNRVSKIEKDFLLYYKDTKDEEIKKICEYVKNNTLKIYNDPLYDEYMKRSVPVLYDNDKNMHYLMHESKKLYFKKGLSKRAIINTYNRLCWEQDYRSPHYYRREKYCSEEHTILDIGGAEGIFSLNMINNIKQLFVFECDHGWVEALEATFYPWRNKVHIIEGYVTNYSDNARNICLDEYFKNYKNTDISLIKLDIEGEEVKALTGARKVIENNNCDLLVCSYHYESQEMDIKELMKEKYVIEINNGFICFLPDENLKAPYLRHGVINCERK